MGAFVPFVIFKKAVVRVIKQTVMAIKIKQNFFNTLVGELDKKYFPDVKYYMDNKKTTKIHHTVELFNNGCLTYVKMIDTLSKACSDSKENIHSIVSKHIEDFGGFDYKPL